MNSLKEIENSFLLTLKPLNLDIDEYNLSNLIDSIKDKFLRQMIKKYNLFNIENHSLRDERNFIKDKTTYSSLKNDKEFNFKQIEKEIKRVFLNYSVKDRIKELMPFITIEKVFNKEKKKYFSFYDFEKTTTTEEIKNTINNLNDLPFNAYGLKDKYNKVDSIKKILEFIKYAFNIEIDLKSLNLYECDLNTIQTFINCSQKEFKIRFCSEWFYLSFNTGQNMNILKDMVINSLLNRIKKD
jgi:hypothetical protein